MKASLLKNLMITTVAATAFAAGAVQAAPVSFTITAATVTGGTGYGTETTESNASTLLDVLFPTTAIATQNFALTVGGMPYTFNIGNIVFREANGNPGITAGETDNLGVTATFTFTAPAGGGTKIVTTTGVAELGQTQDNVTDFSIDWSPLTVGFGTYGKYQISLNDLFFDGRDQSNARTLMQSATVTLLSEDVRPADVPEPGSLALAGLGMLAAVAVRRRKQ